MLAWKAKPRGLETKVGEPKGENENGLGVGERPLHKYARPMFAGKAKPRGPEKGAIGAMVVLPTPDLITKGPVLERINFVQHRYRLRRRQVGDLKNKPWGRMGPGSFRIGPGQAAEQISTCPMKGGQFDRSPTHTRPK